MSRVWHAIVIACVLSSVSLTLGEEAPEYVMVGFDSEEVELQPLAMIELEEHEDTPTPPFSVCKYLLEESAKKVSAKDQWSQIAKHIASVREALPEHVRTACDSFIKHNKDDIISLLQVSVSNDELTAALTKVASEQDALETSAAPAQTTGEISADASQTDQQAAFKNFWEQKGQYCGACLTLTKKIQKWLSLNCTQAVLADRVMRMCGTMPADIKQQCIANRLWIEEFVIKQLLNKMPLPNHCAYIGLCEKTMVIRALQNPMVSSSHQNALLEQAEGSGRLIQENELVLQVPHDTVNTIPEVTFDLSGGAVSYNDLPLGSGQDLPKIYVDGTREAISALETESKQFDLSNPSDPQFTVHGQDAKHVNVPIMHADIKANKPFSPVQNTYNFQENKLPIEMQFLKGCAACQFAIGAMFEFLNNPRTIRTLLPSVKHACHSCNNPDEVLKCENLVEMHGVSFYRDVVRQATAQKWCPRLELCEIQYFIPSPHVLSDHYARIKDTLTKVSDF
eukprot:c7735_g1_i1.p1 GENE.c7735_g1_i1~~c7735_g1_i1.p1  ORF type:complete len:509 (+),score=133.32 c7735_g1_i1:39-1565(+)